jgi:hypothetical protein
MVLKEILERKIDSFVKERNEKIIETINFLVDEFDKKQSEIDLLFDEIEKDVIPEDYFFKNLKKEEYKKKATVLEESVMAIEKRWSELILILNERFNKS